MPSVQRHIAQAVVPLDGVVVTMIIENPRDKMFIVEMTTVVVKFSHPNAPLLDSELVMARSMMKLR